MSLKTVQKIRTLRLTSKIHVLIKWKACSLSAKPRFFFSNLKFKPIISQNYCRMSCEQNDCGFWPRVPVPESPELCDLIVDRLMVDFPLSPFKVEHPFDPLFSRVTMPPSPSSIRASRVAWSNWRIKTWELTKCLCGSISHRCSNTYHVPVVISIFGFVLSWSGP